MDIDGNFFHVASVFSASPSENIRIYAEIGYEWWDVSFNVKTESAAVRAPVSEEIDDGNDLFWGIGVEYQFTPNFSLYGEYEYHYFEVSDVSLFAGGLQFHF